MSAATLGFLGSNWQNKGRFLLQRLLPLYQLLAVGELVVNSQISCTRHVKEVAASHRTHQRHVLLLNPADDEVVAAL